MASITKHQLDEPTVYSRKAIKTLNLGHGPRMRPGTSAWLKPVVLYDDDLKKVDSKAKTTTDV